MIQCNAGMGHGWAGLLSGCWGVSIWCALTLWWWPVCVEAGHGWSNAPRFVWPASFPCHEKDGQVGVLLLAPPTTCQMGSFVCNPDARPPAVTVHCSLMRCVPACLPAERRCHWRIALAGRGLRYACQSAWAFAFQSQSCTRTWMPCSSAPRPVLEEPGLASASHAQNGTGTLILESWNPCFLEVRRMRTWLWREHWSLALCFFFLINTTSWSCCDRCCCMHDSPCIYRNICVS